MFVFLINKTLLMVFLIRALKLALKMALKKGTFYFKNAFPHFMQKGAF